MSSPATARTLIATSSAPGGLCDAFRTSAGWSSTATGRPTKCPRSPCCKACRDDWRALDLGAKIRVYDAFWHPEREMTRRRTVLAGVASLAVLATAAALFFTFKPHPRAKTV